MRVEDALERYVLQLRADGRSVHTIKQYERHVRLLARWIRATGRTNEIAEIDHESVAAFLVSDAARLRPDVKPKKSTAMNALRSSVRTFFGYLHAAGHIESNPSRLVRRARCEPPPPRALSGEEWQRLLDVLDGAETRKERRDRVLFRLMLGCALRIGSALALEVGDLDLYFGVIHVGAVKGARPYRAVVPADLVPMLRGHVGERTAGPLFPGRNGRMTTRHAQRRFAAWAERAGIRKAGGTHTLRHTRAAEIYRKTRDVLMVKEVLGHRSIASTLIYARVDERWLREAVGG